MLYRRSNIVDSFFDKVVVINLDERVDKWRRLSRELRGHGVRHVERFSAIRASLEQVPESFYSEMTNPYGNVERETYLRGSIGCKLSHLSVLQAALKESCQRILILEDDASFKWRAFKRLEKAISELPEDWEMLYFGGNHLGAPTKISKNLAKISKTYTTYAYAINLAIGQLVINSAYDDGSEIDLVYANKIHPIRNCYTITPLIAAPRPGISDISCVPSDARQFVS